MPDPTPMDRHAALGPIAWTEGGMRATTRDGFEACIGPTDWTAVRVVTIVAPNGFETSRFADSLRDARVIIGQEITRQREILRDAEDVSTVMWRMFRQVEDAARAARPGPEGRTEDA